MPALHFSINDVPESDRQSFDPIPEGWYAVIITASDLKTTKDGTGEYIKLEHSVVGPTHKGRRIFGNLNIKNRNPQTVQIAKKQLAQLCTACGKGEIRRTEELHGIPVMAKVAIRPERGEYAASNDIKGYKPTEARAAQPSAVVEVEAEREAPTSVPWAK